MQKRYQITVPFWMADILEELKRETHVTASEIARVLISVGLCTAVKARWPEYKVAFEDCPPEHLIKNFELGDKATRSRFWSEHDFEAQRAVRHYREHIADLIEKVKKKGGVIP